MAWRASARRRCASCSVSSSTTRPATIAITCVERRPRYVFMRLRRLDVVDAAARAPTRLVRESRSCRDGAVPTQERRLQDPGHGQ